MLRLKFNSNFDVTPKEIGLTIPSQKYVGEVAEYAGVTVSLRHTRNSQWYAIFLQNVQLEAVLHTHTSFV
jgi:hypothetical protein